jgi:aspartyl-tRNA(Asn)/glutamyl-tRNA(Gln) amidotransferase subunit B
MAAYFESCTKASGQAKLASNWTMGEVSRRLNVDGLDIAACPVSPEQLGAVISRVADGTISNNAARQVFDALWQTPAGTAAAQEVDTIIEAKGLKQMNDTGALEAIIDEVLAANADNIVQYRAGKDKAFNALVGQAMKASKGKGNPAQINALLRARLD